MHHNDIVREAHSAGVRSTLPSRCSCALPTYNNDGNSTRRAATIAINNNSRRHQSRQPWLGQSRRGPKQATHSAGSASPNAACSPWSEPIASTSLSSGSTGHLRLYGTSDTGIQRKVAANVSRQGPTSERLFLHNHCPKRQALCSAVCSASLASAWRPQAALGSPLGRR